jgi:CRISPR-associated protein Cpf1
MKNLEQFIGIYPVSKTLRFELKPVLQDGQTIDNFWNVYLNSTEDDILNKLYKNDKERNDNYPIMKALLDQFHKKFIASALEQFDEGEKGVSWVTLAMAYQADKKSKTYRKLQEEMRKKIRKSFEQHKWWPYISSYSQLIGSLMEKMVVDDDDFVESVQESNPKMELDSSKMLKAIRTFKNFSVYFGNYQDNRNNMYSEKDQTTSIANRIVNENFPKFLDNIIVYQRLKEFCPNELKVIEDNLIKSLNGLSLDDIFVPEYYNNCLTQDGIERYNWLLGGNPNEGVLGINSVGNEYLHQHPDSKLKIRNMEMTKLFKQILSDRMRISFLPEQFSSDDELMQSVSAFLEGFDSIDIFDRIQEVMNLLKDNDTNKEKIYVQGKNLPKISTLLYGKWNVLGEKLRSTMVTGSTKKAHEELDKEIEAWLENKCFSLAQIQAVEKELMEQSAHPLTIMELFTDLNIWKYDSENKNWYKKSLINICKDAHITQFNDLMKQYKKEGLSIKTDAAKEVLKSVLDSYMELFHLLELLRLGKMSPYIEKDDFYTQYELLFESEDKVLISHIVPLYMKVQSYLTRKLTNKEKKLLKFDSPTRANGWDDCSIVIKDGKYYLILYLDNLAPEEVHALYSDNTAQLVIYQQQKTDYKNAPRLFINSKGNNQSPAVSKYDLPIEMIEPLYKERKALNSQSAKKAFDELHPDYNKRLIDYYKIGLLRHEDFSAFRHLFESMWKNSSDYNTVQDFFAHTQEMCYMLSFKPIAFDYLYYLQNKKRLLLFHIINKDFQEGAKGTPNMHTLYWNELFSKENLKNIIFKLSSQGIEFFYREAISKKEAFVHKKGSILVNKTFSDGTLIDTELYKKFLRHFNGLDVELKSEEVNLLPKVRTKKAKFELMKDKRYHEHKFFLHVPITINFKASGTTQKQFNERTLDILRRNKKDLNIIGIDRGERNLIYVSVINQKGENLITPRHFNLIGNYDYLAKLKQTEKNRDEARRNWTTIERIKDLKSGYLSQVVHEIAKLVVQFNAIVVLEDLNFGFKRGRFNVERQVYQNFEKMLIQKLNYLAFKKDAPSQEYGNIRSGLQLTAPFTSFKDLGKQSGWLFYVPAGYTSKIDPSTGFVNIFNMNKPANSLQEFFAAFDEITYRDGLFYFTFNYSKEAFNTVKTDYTNVWTLASHESRIVGKEKKLKDLTEEFTKFFEKEAKLPLERVSVKTVSALDESKLKELWGLFKLMLKMRNSNDEQDYIISPVASDTPFISGPDNSMQITDADANGAYNIALKGLYWLWNNFPTDEKGYLKYIKDEDWFWFIQTKPYLKD